MSLKVDSSDYDLLEHYGDVTLFKVHFIMLMAPF